MTTKIDIYSAQKANITGDAYKTLKKIGTPRGNEGFFGEMFQIPAEHFYVNDLDNLVKMLGAGRIDLLLFERSASMSTINQLKVAAVHYNLMDDSIKAGFAVRKDKDGQALKTWLEEAVRQIDQARIFKDFFQYTELPDQGVLNP